MGHLVLIDGHHFMYRAYFAIPRTLRTKSGEQTNTVFGVASMLLTILKTEEPTHLALCFDEGEETFRHQEHEEYKEGRPETPEEFYEQIPRVMELIDSFDFKHVSDLKYEADDFLCAYARVGEEEGMRVTVVTGDHDALQLATEKTRIAIPHKGYSQAEYLDARGVEEKYGVRPDQIPSYKGLTGDSSDNLPGVKGIGPKTAAMLLKQYGTLQGIYGHLGELKPAVRAKLQHDREQAFFCERMAELVCDMELPYSLNDLELKRKPIESAMSVLRACEFTVLIKRFQALLESDYGRERFAVGDVLGAARLEEDQMAMF